MKMVELREAFWRRQNFDEAYNNDNLRIDRRYP